MALSRYHAHHVGSGCPYTAYYLAQAQGGHGIPNFYAGAPYQRGHGFGDVLRSLFRLIIPVASKAAKAVGKQALIAGSNVVTDTLINNKPIKESLDNRWRETRGILADKASAQVKQMLGNGHISKRSQGTRRQSASSRSRRRTPARRRRKTPKKAKNKTAKKAIRKKKKRVASFLKKDIFD
ncbi:hypothetical protein FOCC_FOCC000582 [Frankliniella occidentalis]|nr:hypothetical protein FOCC_FOCC000582 [Frankliniella occidentalis]